MLIQIEKETDIELDLNYEEIIHRIVNAVLDYEECPYEIELSVTLTDNDNIAEINKEYRNIDRATDVLSFPLVDYDAPADFSKLEDATFEYFNAETGELMLGDIIVSLEKVKEQAKEYGHSEIREFAFLIAHSMLHLLGYDHMEEDERIIMEEKQKEILEKEGYKR